ncbi:MULTISPECIES: RNA polymerase sigma factor [unclassified Microbacterium]|uniref:RNA polymerase sigma factor n=1 Tax=unclassified Microbacterium TaxID=2609290 RepID=UPI0012F9D8D3|nr:sigma-70 family RNA polymerase sigma factor [Microbacterium sp. MAH-37]MVQ41409.1 sigma-70 family RNA polymerase sigma factor [Microbacterium sp. MAH-37]
MTSEVSSRPITISADAQRVEVVIRREAPALLAYFERRCTPEDAADLLGETLLVTWRRISALPDDDEGARMWLFGVARRVLATGRRSGIRRSALVDRLREDARQRPTSSDSVDDELHAALASLSTLDAEIIRLLHWDGFSLTEIAQHLNKPASTIRSRYSRARAALRTELERR